MKAGIVLHDYLVAKCGDGIPAGAAEQLIFELFCTLDVLPVQIRKLKLDKSELAYAFSTLAAGGKIKPDYQDVKTPTSSQYWEDVIQRFMRGEEKITDAGRTWIADFLR